MPDRLDSSEELCRYLKDTEVPVMIVCKSNQDAAALYEAGCTYVVQEDFLGGKEVAEMLWLEMSALQPSGSSLGRYPTSTSLGQHPTGPNLNHTGSFIEEHGSSHNLKHGSSHNLNATPHADTSSLFALRAVDHKEELAEEESDLVRSRFGMFI